MTWEKVLIVGAVFPCPLSRPRIHVITLKSIHHRDMIDYAFMEHWSLLCIEWICVMRDRAQRIKNK